MYRDASASAVFFNPTSTAQADASIITPPAKRQDSDAVPASCGRTTINAPNVNPIFWSAGIELYWSRVGGCIVTEIGTLPSIIETEIGYSYSTNSPFTPSGSLGAASTAVVTVYNPDFNPTSTSAVPIVRVTDTAGAVATFEAVPVFNDFNPSTVPVTQVLTADTGGVSYTVTSGPPVMVYTAIQIVESTYTDGSCSPTTSWAALQTPVINTYPDINGTIADWSDHSVQGDIPQNILKQIEEQFEKVDGWVAGTYKGLPTVNVAVYYTVALRCASPQYILTSVDALVASTTPSRSTEIPPAATQAISPPAPAKPPATVFQPSTVGPAPSPVVVPSSSGRGLGGIILSLFQPNPEITATAVDAAQPPLSTKSAVDTSSSTHRSFTLPTAPPPSYVLTEYGSTLIAMSKTAALIESQALVTETPSITNSAHTTSYGFFSTEMIAESSADPFAISTSKNLTAAPTMTAPPPVMTIGTARITANTNSDFVIADQTVTPGGLAVTISGIIISVGPGATAVVVGSNTINLVAPTGAPNIPIYQGGSVKSSTFSGWAVSLCGCLGVILMELGYEYRYLRLY
ncbi:hypothetical protein MMC30_006554 [Trapelia coarctata]|nr:hypothetical protein [Trapelia coarctata]